MINTMQINTINTTPKIAGVMPNDSNIEFIGVRESQTVLWMQNGSNHYFTDLPHHYYTLLKEAYLSDPKAVEFLSQVNDRLHRQVELYTYYMYGAVDGTPDISNGVLSISENYRHDVNCPSLLWNSKNINIKNHVLTNRQLVIIDMIASNFPDKAIASALGITIKTLDFHKNNLFKALKVSTRVELLMKSIKHQVILA